MHTYLLSIFFLSISISIHLLDLTGGRGIILAQTQSHVLSLSPSLSFTARVDNNMCVQYSYMYIILSIYQSKYLSFHLSINLFFHASMPSKFLAYLQRGNCYDGDMGEWTDKVTCRGCSASIQLIYSCRASVYLCICTYMRFAS